MLRNIKPEEKILNADLIEVKTTFDKKEDAAHLAETLLDKNLIACGQILEIESHYVWQGKREITKEYALVMKTRLGLFDEIERVVNKLHPYDCPELIATNIVQGSVKYCDWIIDSTKGHR